MSTKRKTQVEFVEEMKNLYPWIEVRGEYRNNKTPIQCFCERCEEPFESRPNDLLSGHIGCKCRKDEVKTTEGYATEIAKLNPDIEVVGEYLRASKPIALRCKACGAKWTAKSAHDFERTPICIRGRNHEKMLPSDFDLQVSEVNPWITIGSEFHGPTSYIDCECNVCGTKDRFRAIRMLTPLECSVCKKKNEYDRAKEEFEREFYQNNENIKLLSSYVNRGTKIQYRCTVCQTSGERFPSQLSKGIKCKVCKRNQKLANRKRHNLTHEEFAERIQNMNPNLELVSTYTGLKKEIDCKCKRCENVWPVIAGSLQAWPKCPTCDHTKNNWTHKSFVDAMSKINPRVRIVGKYKNNSTPIACVCTVCGHKWSPKPAGLLAKYGCSKCAGVYHYTNEEFIAEMAERRPTIRIEEPYIDCHTSLKTTCLKCGLTKSRTPVQIRNYGCKYCGDHDRFVENKFDRAKAFLEKFEQVDSDFEIIDINEFEHVCKSIAVRCKWCGRVDQKTPNQLREGVGCKACRNPHTSFFEQLLYWASVTAFSGEEVLSRDKTSIGSELDIVISGINLAFEPGGWFYHKTKLKQDSFKRDNAKKAGIRLITIYYFVPDDLSFADDNIILFKGDASVGNSENIINWIEELLEYLGHTHKFTGDERIQMVKNAVETSRRMPIEKVFKMIKEKNPYIKIEGEYKGKTVPLACYCEKCKIPFTKQPFDLLWGKGCPSCGKKKGIDKRRKSIEILKNEVATHSPDIEILGNYVNADTRIKIRCRKCGTEWFPYASTLCAGKTSCSVCRQHHKTRNQESFVAEMQKVNPDVIITGKFVNVSQKISWTCAKCGEMHESRPSDMLRGHGCRCKKNKIAKAVG